MDKNFQSFGGKVVKSPITGNMYCLEEEYNGIKSWICLESGYSSNELYKEGNEEYEAMLENVPSLVSKLKFYDTEREVFWFLSIFDFPGRGIVYPIGDNIRDWNWAYTPRVKLTDEEKKEADVDPNKEYERMAIEKTETFGKKEFYKAMKALGAIIDLDKIGES